MSETSRLALPGGGGMSRYAEGFEPVGASDWTPMEKFQLDPEGALGVLPGLMREFCDLGGVVDKEFRIEVRVESHPWGDGVCYRVTGRRRKVRDV